MANDLVRYSGLIEEDPAARHPRPTPDVEGYRAAQDDIEDAAIRGDDAFRATRQADAADAVQNRWDWGDARTWAILWAMAIGFLLFCWFVHSLPTGAHCNPVPIRVY